MSAESSETEIMLTAHGFRLKVSPYGASLRGLWRETPGGQPATLIAGYTGTKGKVGGQGDVLIPFPGRIRDGRYTFAGETYQLDLNDKDGPNAIHGFLRLVPWEIRTQSVDSVTFEVALNAGDHPGYPFSLHVSLTYSLTQTGLTCRFTIDNTGVQAAPVAAGFHPYFTVGLDFIDADTLQVPMEATLEFADLLPTGQTLPVANTPYDFRQPRPIGETVFNTCFLNPLRDADGLLRLRLADPQDKNALTIWMDQAFDYVVLYSGDPLPETHRRRALAIEPMTCGSDAFNYPEWGLVSLPPGQSFSGSWGISTA